MRALSKDRVEEYQLPVLQRQLMLLLLLEGHLFHSCSCKQPKEHEKGVWEMK